MNKFFRFAFIATLLCLVNGIAGATSNLANVTFNITGASESNVTAPATPALQTVKSSAGVLALVYCYNANATPVYLHFYNSTSVTIGTTSAPVVYGCPGNTAGAGFVMPIFIGIAYSTAIAYYVSSSISRTSGTGDTIAVNTVLIDTVYQ